MNVAARAPSLVIRLVIALATVSVLVTGAAALALDALYRGLALDARREVLDAQVIALIATAEVDAAGRLAPGSIAEPRLATPGSGLIAEIRDSDGVTTWRSPSMAGAGARLDARPSAGQRLYEPLTLPDGRRFLSLSLGVTWETGDGPPATYVFSAAESLEPYYAELARVRGSLAAGAAVMMLLLVIGLVMALRAGLRPLARLETQILELEEGRRDLLEADWPRELAGVTGNLNVLVAGERNRLARYRSTLGNLAHSLKTPIAALKGLIDGGSLTPSTAAPELDRMQSIVDHQLRRAVLGGAGSSVAAIELRPPLEQLAAALSKVYRDRRVDCQLAVPAGLAYPVEAGDLLELAGNLLDNAYKYGRQRVRITAAPLAGPEWRRPGLVLVVEDDGPGIAGPERLRVLERGVRADETLPGQGIGLAAARDVVVAYGGTIEIGDSALGGARVQVRLPGR